MNHLREILDDIVKQEGITSNKFAQLADAYVEKKFGEASTAVQEYHRRVVLFYFSRFQLTFPEFQLLLRVIRPEMDDVKMTVTINDGPTSITVSKVIYSKPIPDVKTEEVK